MTTPREIVPHATFDGLVPQQPEMFTTAWWALAHMQTLNEEERAANDAPPPPPGYRYLADGRICPVVELQKGLDTPGAKALFCEVLQYTGSTRAALDAVGLAGGMRVAAQRAMEADPEFMAAVEAAMDRHRDGIYISAYNRAVYGFERPMLGGQFKDQIVAHERVYSDTLAALLLKRHFQEFRNAEPRAGGTTVNVNQNNLTVRAVPVNKLSREQRAQLRGVLSSAANQQLDLEVAAQEITERAQEQEEPEPDDVIDVNCKEK